MMGSDNNGKERRKRKEKGKNKVINKRERKREREKGNITDCCFSHFMKGASRSMCFNTKLPTCLNFYFYVPSQKKRRVLIVHRMIQPPITFYHTGPL